MSSERAQNHLHSPRIGISVPESEHKPDHFQMVASRTQVHKLAKAEDDISKKGDHQVATPTREMELKRYWAQMSAKVSHSGFYQDARSHEARDRSQWIVRHSLSSTYLSSGSRKSKAIFPK
jgi:hypothetical protein